MKRYFLLFLFVITGFLRSQDSSLGVLPLDAPEFNRLELFSISDYVRSEAVATGKFSEGTTLIADVILGTVMDTTWKCDEIECGFDVTDKAGVDQVIVVDLTRIKKTGTDSTGATTVSGNMILYLISPEEETDDDQDKGWVSTVYDRTRRVITGEPRPADNRVNRWHKGSAEDVPEILKVLTWKLLEADVPEGHFSESILSLAQGDFIGKALTFASANGVALALGAGGLLLVGSGFAAGSPDVAIIPIITDPDPPGGFGEPPPFPVR